MTQPPIPQEDAERNARCLEIEQTYRGLRPDQQERLVRELEGMKRTFAVQVVLDSIRECLRVTAVEEVRGIRKRTSDPDRLSG